MTVPVVNGAPSVAPDLPNPPPLTDAQKKLVKATVPVLEEHGGEITRRFYKNMLNAHPELRNVFNHSKQQRGDQAEALARAVYAYAANIDDLTPILPVVERLCHKHASLNIRPQQYAIVGEFLLGAITEVLGSEVFSGELYDAWASAYWQLARLCFGKEEQLYQSAAWRGWKEFVVVKKIVEAEDITSFYFSPKDGKPLPSYKPGQYISVQKYVNELGYNQSRQYSLSDSPRPDYFRISVRRDRGIRAVDPASGKVDVTQSEHLGWLSNLLHDKLAVGDAVEITFPFGDFFLDATTSPVVLISAGVGVTPLFAMLRTALETSGEKGQRPIAWVQVVRSRAAHALRAEVASLLASYPFANVRKTVFYSNPEGDAVKGTDYDLSGRLDLTKVAPSTLYLDDLSTQYYVCGPESFMRDTGKALLALGVGHERIHAEVFGAGAVPI